MASIIRQNLPPSEGLAAALPVIELVAVVALVEVDLWLPQDRFWLRSLVRGLAASVLIASFFRRRTAMSAAASGMTVGRAWLEAAAVTGVLGIAVLAWAAAVSGPFDEPELPLLKGSVSALSLWLLHRLALGCIQQLALQLFLWPVAREMLGSSPRTTVVIAILFGLFHLPSVPLAMATAIAASLWLGLYRRSKRLMPLIMSHALLAGLASILPDRLFYDMKVGAPALEIAADHRSLAGEEKQALLSALTSARYATYRGDTDSGYVEGLYRDILGRLATDEEVMNSVEQLATISRLSLAKRMLLSEELDDSTLWHRFIDDEPLTPGIEILAPVGPPPGEPSRDQAEFVGWYEAESGWRWARDATPVIGFRIDREKERDHVLAISAGAAAPLTVELELNGQVVGSGRFTDFTPLDYRFILGAEHLAADGNNELRFLVSGAPVVLEGDSRALGLGLRELRVTALRFPAAAITFADDDYFLEGFSVAEKQLRWTREPAARMTYPLHEIVPDGCYTLRLEAGAFERQDVSLSVNGQRVAEWTLDGLEPQTRSVRFYAKLLRPGPNTVDFHLPGARSPEGDPRRLGLALISIRIYPLKDQTGSS